MSLVGWARAVRDAFALREGGHTQRLHTMPVVGDASVAKHSWNMATLLYVLFPRCSKDLLWAVLMHDVPERWVGDTPAPAKYVLRPQLGRELKEAEAVVEEELALKFPLIDAERKILKALDILELLMYADDQLNMGNRNLELTRHNCWTILNNEPWVPHEVREFVAHYQWQRTSNVTSGEVMDGLRQEDITDA